MLDKRAKIIGLFKAAQLDLLYALAGAIWRTRDGGQPSTGIYTVIVPPGARFPEISVEPWHEERAAQLREELTELGEGVASRKRLARGWTNLMEKRAAEAQGTDADAGV